MDTCIKKFREKYQLSEVDVATLLERMHEVHLKKKEIVVREGMRNDSLYLIKSGVWRGHCLKNGVDTTLWFATEGEVAFSVWGYVDHSLSQVTIEAMCDSTAYCITGRELAAFFASSTGPANLGRRLMERQMLTFENWLISAGSPKAKERYLALMRETPELIQCVPLKHIASYLWVTPESLSRIRAGLKRAHRS